MVIIASLASIGFGIFFKLREGSKEKETTLLLKNISSQMESIKAETSIPYPISSGDTTDLVKYLTGDQTYFDGQGSRFDVKPAMPGLLEGGAQHKFIKGDKLVDSWKRDIIYIHKSDEEGGEKNNYEGGIDLKSEGIDPDITEDDIEL